MALQSEPPSPLARLAMRVTLRRQDIVLGVRSAIRVSLHAASHATDISNFIHGFLLTIHDLMPNCTSVRLERFPEPSRR